VRIRVCSLAGIAESRDFGAEYLVSVIGPALTGPEMRPPWIQEDSHFVFHFDDVVDPGYPTGPKREHLVEIVDLGRELCAPDSSAAVLIHCAAGISRSPATAFIFFCIHLGPGRENEALTRTAQNSESPWIWPNALMVRYADEMLGREGHMVRTLTDWESGRLTVPA